MNVYIIETIGKFKIGFAKNIANRLKAIQSANPTELTLVHSFESDQADQAEKLLHLLFRNKRVRGEWFALSQNDLNFIRTISGFYNGSFAYSDNPVDLYQSNEETRDLMTYQFVHNGEPYFITERQVFDFLQTAWRRKNGGQRPLSRNYWLKSRRPSINEAQYNAIMHALVENGIVVNRRFGAQGDLIMSPDEAMAIITGEAHHD